MNNFTYKRKPNLRKPNLNSGPGAIELAQMDRKDAMRSSCRIITRSAHRQGVDAAKREAVRLADAGYGVDEIVKRTGVSRNFATRIVTGD